MPQAQLVDRLDTLARLEPTSLPLLSLYLNTETNSTGRPTFEVFLRKELRDRVKAYEERSAEREGLKRDVERIENYVAHELKRSTRGLAIFACSGQDLFEAIQLEVPFDGNRLAVTDRPHLYPLARLNDEYPRYAAIVVDTNVARIFVFSTGSTTLVTEVQSPKTKHMKAGGWSQARLQRHVENVHLQHVKEVVERLDQIVAAETIDQVVVAGDDVIVALLKQQLPERLTAKLVDVLRLDIRSPHHEVLSATLVAVQRKDKETDEAVVRDLIGEYRAGGLALVGAERVLAALRQGQVDRLIITAVPEQVNGGDEAANELITLASQTSASVRFIESSALLADVGGVGAWLRYLRGGLIQAGSREATHDMSKNINVNPDHYKVAGRERQGEDVVHEIEKREVKRLRRAQKRVLGQPRSNNVAKQARKAAQKRRQPESAGISNRLSAESEARELERHPPLDTSSPPPEDAAGRVGEEPLEDRRDRHTSHKAGSRSIAQKEAGARYPDRSTPASRKVAGAFGREPQTHPQGPRAKRQKKRTRSR
jgi:peptide subunit release factor 1 (eRF1)